MLAGALATVCLLVIGFAAGHATKSGPAVAQAAQRVKTVGQTKTITDAPARSTPAIKLAVGPTTTLALIGRPVPTTLSSASS